jgi:hypothetical protein
VALWEFTILDVNEDEPKLNLQKIEEQNAFRKRFMEFARQKIKEQGIDLNETPVMRSVLPESNN